MNIQCSTEGWGVDSLVGFQVACRCPRRRRPAMRMSRWTVKLLLSLWGPRYRLGTYRCGSCGAVVDIMTGSADLEAPSTEVRGNGRHPG